MIARFVDTARDLTYVIVSDSQTAIKAVEPPSCQSGYPVIPLIMDTSLGLRRREGPDVHVQCPPLSGTRKSQE